MYFLFLVHFAEYLNINRSTTFGLTFVSIVEYLDHGEHPFTSSEVYVCTFEGKGKNGEYVTHSTYLLCPCSSNVCRGLSASQSYPFAYSCDSQLVCQTINVGVHQLQKVNSH